MKNVLLVDDDNIFNFLNSTMLQRTGMAGEIHTALNGQQALDMLNGYLSGNAALPDVILLDLNMPVMDGFGFLEAFKKILLPRKETVSIVIVTSSSNEKDIDRARTMGITRYLIKPVDEDQLKDALSSES